MLEIRKTTMFDSRQVLTYRPSAHLRRLQAQLDGFIAYVDANLASASGEVRASAAARFRTLCEEIRASEVSPGVLGLFPDADVLQRVRLDYVCGLLGLQDEDPEKETPATRLAAARAKLLPAYHQTLALAEAIGRNEAIPHVKAFIDDWMNRNTKANESLEDPGLFWDAIGRGWDDTEIVAARLGRGKIVMRTNRCLWADVLRPLGNAELAYAGACYGDYRQIGSLNLNFVFTRTMTLVQGDPYCDACVHDRRFVDSIEHPARELYDSLV